MLQTGVWHKSDSLTGLLAISSLYRYKLYCCHLQDDGVWPQDFNSTSLLWRL